MVFPLYDDNTDRTTTPIVNYVLIAINILVFVFLQQLGNERQISPMRSRPCRRRSSPAAISRRRIA